MEKQTLLQLGFFTRLLTVRDLRRNILPAYFAVWQEDVSLRSCKRRLDRFTNRINRYHQQQQNTKDVLSENRKVGENILLLLPIWAAILDFFVVGKIFEEITDNMSGLQPWLAAFLGCVAFVLLELCIGAGVHNRYKQFQSKEENKDKYNLTKYLLFATCLLGLIFISIVPLFSISEYRDNVGIISQQLHLQITSPEAAISSVSSLKIKYTSLALMSFCSHGFLLFGHALVINSAGSALFRQALEKAEDRWEELKVAEDMIQEKLVLTLVRFHQVHRLHLSLYPEHDGLPEAFFSPEVMKVYHHILGNASTSDHA